MNWKLIIMLLFVLQHAYTLVLNMVQMRSANNPTPANVADVYDAQTYAKWKRYSGENSRLSILRNFASLALTLVMLGFDVHAAVAGWFSGNVVVQLIAVLLTQTIAETLVFTGFSWYDTLVIEEKYGFNRATKKTFILDTMRNFLVEIVISILLMGALCALHRWMGDWVVVLFTAVVFGFTLIISFLYGPVFSRMGNKFVPLEDGELKDKLQALLTKHGYQVKAIEVMDASRRTTKLNAYFTGFGKLKSIVLYDNLLNAMTPNEICAVFAHELGHGLHKDVLKQQMMTLGNLFLMAVAVWLTIRTPVMHEAFGFAEVNYGFAFILLGAFLGLIQPVTGMLTNAYSRHAEYRADRQAVKEGYGEDLAGGLKKLARENFSHLAPSPLLVALEYSHPPLSERIAAVEAALRQR